MESNEAVFVLSLDAEGNLTGVTMDGKEGYRNECPPDGTPDVVWSLGSDPGKGDGIELLDYNGKRCIHFFCNVYCF